MRAVAMACAALLCGQVSAAAESRQACRPVFHSRLEALLPVLPGFGRNRPKGETDNLDAVSRTTVDYEAEAAVVSIELIDSCRNPDMPVAAPRVPGAGAAGHGRNRDAQRAHPRVSCLR